MSKGRRYHVNLHYSCIVGSPEEALALAIDVVACDSGLTVEVFEDGSDVVVLDGDHGQLLAAATPAPVSDELPRITTDTDWVELDQGQHALIFGTLDGPMNAATTSFVVRNAAWGVFAIESAFAATPTMPAGTAVKVCVERIEDGMELLSIEEQPA